MTASNDGVRMKLAPLHWEILNLIRIWCYEGLLETKTAFVDPTDRHLPRWEPNDDHNRFVLPNGVPEPLVTACLYAMPFHESEERWGKDSHPPGPALQYLIDRKLLDVSYGNTPICAAFMNYFDNSEILTTIRIHENENGRFYVWDVPRTEQSTLHEQNGPLVTSSRYRVFKLTERAHTLLDTKAKGNGPAETTSETGGLPKKRGRKPGTNPQKDRRIAEAWSTGQYRTYADLERELKLVSGEARRAIDRHRKRKKSPEK